MRVAQDLVNRPYATILEVIIRQNVQIRHLLLPRGRGPARETLLYFAVARAFRELSGTIAGYHVAPERDRSGMAHIFDDFPVAREAVEDQSGGIAADASSPVLHSNEELRHSIVRGLFTRHGDARPRDQGKADRIG